MWGKNPRRWSHPPPLCGPTSPLRRRLTEQNGIRLRCAGSTCGTTKPGMPSGGDLQGPQEESSGVWLRPQARFEANRRRRLLGRDGASKRPSGLWVLSPGRKYHLARTAPPAALFSCTVNGTFSFRRDEKRMWGWNCGFLRISRADWLAPPQPVSITVCIICCSVNRFLSKSTVMLFISRLTATEPTPASRPTIFSMQALQAAQDIPVI